MPSTHFDALIIGTGQAGPYLAGRFTGAGMTVAIVERNRFGGTCVNTGCIPTKTMVASAEAAHVVRRAAEFGVDVGAPTVDMRRVKARMDEVSGHSRTGLEEWLKTMERCTVFEGHARFVSPYEVAVGQDVLTADRIFLNVGGRATVPELPGLADVPFLTNSTMLDVDFLPRHLLIVGGSYIGLEFGQMFRRFGSEVTIVEMGPRLIKREDEDVSAVVESVFAREGIAVRTDAECIGFARRGDTIVGRVDCTEGAPEIDASHVLLAVGRRPNTDDLGLAEAGIAVDEHGYVVVDDQLQTSVRGIWALGDCNGRGAFTHTSFNDAEVVASNLLDHEPRRVSDRITAYALYVDPALGRCGLTEAEVRRRGRPALVGKRLMTDVKRARIKGETDGFMKITVDAETREILGAAVLGPGGDEIIHSILDVMYAKQPVDLIRRAMHIHPTVSELIPTMCGELRPLV